MLDTSLVEVAHGDITEIPSIAALQKNLAGLHPVEFDKAVRPIRKFLDQFNEGGELAQLMLVDNVTNHFVDGLYVRELLLPAGAFVLSRVHKKPLINIISQGYVIVIDSNGYNEYEAPCTFTSEAGTQRIVYAPVETVWNTAHPTDVQNKDDIVDELTSDNYEDYLAISHQLAHQD